MLLAAGGQKVPFKLWDVVPVVMRAIGDSYFFEISEQPGMLVAKLSRFDAAIAGSSAAGGWRMFMWQLLAGVRWWYRSR